MNEETSLTATLLLKDVPRHLVPRGNVLYEAEVLAALSRALDPALAEQAGALTKRLRKTEEAGHVHHLSKADRLAAADLITALLAQNAALRAERDEHRRNWERAFNANTALEERLAAAEAKVEKLRGALVDLTAAFAKKVDVNRTKWRMSYEHPLSAYDRAMDLLAALTTEEGHE